MAFEWLTRATSSEDWIRPEKEPDAILSQFGFLGRPFHNRPRLEGRPSKDAEIEAMGRIYERDLSMIEGRLTAAEVSRAVLGRSDRKASVRYFPIPRLWEKDFGVYRSPTPRIPQHASVVPHPGLKIPHDDLAQNASFWDTGGTERLDECAAEGENDDRTAR